MTVTYSKYRMIPAELQGLDTSDEDEDEYFTQDDARIELPTKLRESFIIFGVGPKYGLRCTLLREISLTALPQEGLGLLRDEGEGGGRHAQGRLQEDR